MDNRIKIMLTDVNEDARSMLQDALEETGRFTVVGSTGDGNEVLEVGDCQNLGPLLAVHAAQNTQSVHSWQNQIQHQYVRFCVGNKNFPDLSK